MSVKSITPTDLKTILHSKRANIYYLEKCRIQVNGGRVEYVTQEGKESFYWNIPIANTTAVMLGMGTSVTQMAMREFARAGVMVGFCGTDGTPLYSANEVDIDVSWLSPQSEYRPTAYLQNWVSFWFDEEKRLQAAKQFQFIRLQQIETQWAGARMQRETAFQPDKGTLEAILERARQGMENAQDHTSLMLKEAQLTKSLYKLASQTVGYGCFTRAKRGGGADMANRFLDQGNYLVPLMTGYQRISELYAPGVVENARDAETPFAFTEAVYGVGEWCGLHRIRSLDEIFWRYRTTETGYYCQGAGAPVTSEPLN